MQPRLVGSRRASRTTNRANGESVVGVLDFGLEEDVRRIVRAFHAALYNECLPGPDIRVSLPFAAGRAPSGIPEVEPLPDWHEAAVIDLLRSKQVDRLDQVVCDNDECEYACTWMPPTPRTRGLWRCVFGMRLHTWGNLGEPAFSQRGCVGFYCRVEPEVLRPLPSSFGSGSPTRSIPLLHSIGRGARGWVSCHGALQEDGAGDWAWFERFVGAVRTLELHLLPRILTP